ncbi:MAG: adenine phosphoribosyltransferase [Ignavibacteriae bacterium]|nr:adenine phosphoribosyltransferase [Ignavibacteriota bacterium]
MVNQQGEELRSCIRNIPNFPKKGVVFRDITTLLQNREAFKKALDILYERYRGKQIDKVVSVESRGFIFGSVLAYRLGAGFVPVRKPKKLPSKTIRAEYQLEYGTDALEIHVDAIKKGDHVLVVDDLIATGGTAAASCKLVEKSGGIVVGLAFLIELSFLHGREKLKNYDIFSIITYDSE